MLLVLRANRLLPALTAQNVGRELYHQRYNVVQIIGARPTLQKIAWIFARASDMFDIRFQYDSLVVRRAHTMEIAGKDAKSIETATVESSIPVPEYTAG